jgi:RHS repeat-associated protein
MEQTKTDRLKTYTILTILFIAVTIALYPISSNAAPPSEDSEKHIVLSVPESDAQMGTASSSIPILVPPGRNGIQPNLALSYSSSNKRSGLLGVGWDLSLGYIQRNTRSGLDYSNNENDNPFIVSMEGASGELVHLGSSYYGLEIEGAFYKFYFNQSANYWEVTSKDGTKYYFGLNTDHNNSSTNSRQTDPSNSSRVYKWCLDKVIDTNGNYMEISYVKISNEIYPNVISYTGNSNTGFNPNPTYFVKFHLENHRETTDPIQPAHYYNPGFEVIPSKRIKTIEILYGSTLVRAYALNYLPGGSPDSNKSLLQSVQQYGSNAQVNQTTGAITSGSALPAINLEYYNNPRNYLAYSNAPSPRYALPYYPSQADFNGDGKMDFLIMTNDNNFNKNSIPSLTTYKVFLSNGDGIFSHDSPDSPDQWMELPHGWACTPSGYGSDYICQYQAPHVNLLPGDFDGDGKADLFYYDLNGEKKVLLSNGNGTFSEQAPITSLYNDPNNGVYWAINPTLLDFDGDGDTDFIAPKTTLFNPIVVIPGPDPVSANVVGWYLFESNGDGTFTERGEITLGTPAGKIASFQPVDFNGDGKTDLAVRYYDLNAYFSGYYAFKSDGTGSFINQGLGEFITPAPGKLIKIMSWGDFNGDGLSDALVTDDLSAYLSHTIYFSKGDFTFASVHYPNLFNMPSNGVYTEILTGDFNGDGLTDLLPRISGTMRLFLSNGDSTFRHDPSSDLPVYDFNEPDDPGEPYPSDPPYPDSCMGGMAGDFNGDGRTDFLGINQNKRMEIISFADDANVTDLEPLPDTLKIVANGKGGTTTFDYEPSSEYGKETDAIMPFIMQMVSSININDGNGGSYTTSYDYYGADFDFEKREFLGFKNIYKTNNDGSYEVTEYLQDHYFKNRPDWTGFYEDSDDYNSEQPMLSSKIFTAYTWGTYPIEPTTWAFVKLNRKKTTYENNASYYTQEDYTYDNTNGFPEFVVKTGTDANGQAVAQVTRYTGYNLYGTDSWRVSKEIVAEYYDKVSDTATNLARKMTYGYNSQGNMTQKIFWRTASTAYPAIAYTHDGFGNVLTETDGLNHPTTIDYETDTNTYPWHITNAKNQVTTKTWDYKFGKEDIVTDPNNNTTDYNYDLFGRISNIIFPDGGYTENIYTYYDIVTFPRYMTTRTLESGSIAAGSYIEKVEYFDGLDRSIKVITDGINDQEPPASIEIITTTHYDDMGRKSAVYGPYFANEGETSRYYEITIYDKLGRVDYIESPSSVPNEPSTINYVYDNPFTTKIIDPDIKQKTEKRDHLGRIIEVIEHANTGLQTTYYGYNAAGDMTYVENAKGYPTLIDYDARGLKTRMDDPDMGEWHYVYDNNGNLSTQTDAKQNIITFGYDELNRVLSKSYTIIGRPAEDLNYTAATPNVEYRYDGYGLPSCTNCIGQLTSINNTNVLTKYDLFDPMGRVKRVTKTISGDQPRTTLTGYDLSGKVTSIIHPDNYTITNTYYPGTGLLATVTGTPSGGSAVEYAKCTKYEPAGKIGKITHTYNNTKTEYTYDAKTTRLATLLTKGPAPGNVTIQDKSYTYSKAGDIKKINDNLTGLEYNYEYDNLHRLLEETTSDNTLPTDADIMIYNYNDSEHINAVTSIDYNGTDYGFTYDSNGNMKSGYDFTSPASIVQRGLTWNADNMPVTVTRGNTTTNLTYDGDGVRAKKVEVGTTTSTTYYISNDYEIKDSTPIKYIFAGNLRVAEIEGSVSPTVHIYHKDHLGSSTAMTNSAGAKVEGTEYLPFGEMRSHSGLDVSDYMYNDHEVDISSNLYNYDARMYDPVIGRFLSPDTFVQEYTNPQSLNRYSYCINNPLIYIDPSGHFWQEMKNFWVYGYWGTDEKVNELGLPEKHEELWKQYQNFNPEEYEEWLDTPEGQKFEEGLQEDIMNMLPASGGIRKVEKTTKVTVNIFRYLYKALSHKHHTIPKEIMKKLPARIQNHKDIIGRRGLPNKTPVEAGRHLNEIHKGAGGGAYNQRFEQEILKRGGYERVTVKDVLEIRDNLVKEFNF